MDIIYLLGLIAFSPWLLLRSLRTGRYRSDWAARLGKIAADRRESIQISGCRVMIHCVSVGELTSVGAMVREILEADQSVQVILTVTTDTGMARARALYPAESRRVVVLRYPLDFTFAVRRFLNTVRPHFVALVELEVWPNFMAECRRRSIPVEIMNGRMTARSFKRYALVKPLMGRMLSHAVHIGVQSRPIAERFMALGVAEEKITVLPTMKYDTADFSTEVPGAAAMAKALGIGPGQWLLVAGSTGPGEEDFLLEGYTALSLRWPQLRLAIAPRKPEVYSQVLEKIKARGFKVVRRSENPDGCTGRELSGEHIIVLDTMGELRKLYAAAGGIFSGRSLVPLGGSDMIEAAALGRPVCFGPHTWNFADVVQDLLAADAAVEIGDGPALIEAVDQWLKHPGAAAAMSARARAAIAAQSGSSRIYAQRVLTGCGLSMAKLGPSQIRPPG